MIGTAPIDRTQNYQIRSDINCDGVVDQLDLDAVLAARGADARYVSSPCTTLEGQPGETFNRRPAGIKRNAQPLQLP